MMPDSDSDDDLPPGWEERATVDGSVYYVNHSTKSTQWTHPRTGKKKKVAGDEISTNVKGIDERPNQLKLTEPRARMNGARTKRYKWLLSHGHSREEAEILSLKPIDSMGLGKLFKVQRFKKPRSGIITKEAWNKKSRRRNVSTGTTKVQKLSTPSRELPFGWEKVVEDTGKILYVDHENHRTTYTDPRLAFAQEEKDTPLGFRQRFDGSSTALQVLHGRDLSGKTAVITGANCGIGNSKYAENNKMSQDEISKLSASSRHQKIIGDENHKMYEKRQHVSDHFKNTDNATSLQDEKFVSNFNYDQDYATSNSISRPIEEPHKFEFSTLFDNKEEKASKSHEDKRTNMHSQTRETLNQQSSHSVQDQIDELKNRNKRLMDELFDMPKSEETNSSKQQDRGGFQQSLSSRFSQLLDKSQWNPKENKKLFDMPEEPNNSGVTYSPAERDRYSLPQGHSRFSPHQERYFENRGFKGGKDLFDMPQNEQVYSGKTYSLEAQHEPQRHYSRFPNELGMDFDTKKRRVEKEIFDMHKEEIYTSNTNFPLELQNDQRRQDNSLWFPTDNQLFFEKEDSRLRGKTQEIPSADVSTSIQTYPTDKIVRPLSKNAMKVVIVPTCYPSKTITTVIKNQIVKDLSKAFPNIFRSELSRGALLVPCANLHLKKRLYSIIHLHSKPELQLKIMEMEDLESQFTTVQALLLNRNVSSYAFKNKMKKIHPTELNAGAWDIQHSMNSNKGTMFVVKLDNQSLQSIERWFGWIVPYEDTWAEFSKDVSEEMQASIHNKFSFVDKADKKEDREKKRNEIGINYSGHQLIAFVKAKDVKYAKCVSQKEFFKWLGKQCKDLNMSKWQMMNARVSWKRGIYQLDVDDSSMQQLESMGWTIFLPEHTIEFTKSGMFDKPSANNQWANKRIKKAKWV